MIVQFQKWDSDFFGINIGRIDIDKKGSISINLLQKDIKDKKIMLLYCFVNPTNNTANTLLKSMGGKLVDQKVVLSKQILPSNKVGSEKIIDFSGKNIPEELYNLSYESGYFSRFKIDSGFPNNSFERFYSIWLENSIKGIIADKVYVFKIKSAIKGFITVKKNKSKGTIGLVAVDESERGNNIGTNLIKSCENYLVKEGIGKIDVATQNKNTNAINFYLRNGFRIDTRTNIYHLWTKL